MNRRLTDSEDLTATEYDILVVGGGITGAGALLEAGRKGYKAILVEKGDFASGTSSRSGKLAHGGLRYLKYAQFGMVRETLHERDYLLHTYPHLVKPLRFVYPIYRLRSKVEIFAALTLYLLLNFSSKLSGFRYLGRKATLKKFPYLNAEGLRGSFVFHDGVTNDARLTNQIVHEAVDSFSSVALNYCELTALEKNGNRIVATCFDHLENRKVAIKAKYMVNASGPWMDELSQRLHTKHKKVTAPSKGTHIVLSQKRLPVDSSFLFSPKIDDGRVLYTVPWDHGTVLVGATDTDYTEPIDSAKANVKDDIYLLSALQHLAPSLNLTENDILSSYAGVRPLLRDESTTSKDRSREYRIWWDDDRVLNMFGGKLTGFHSMARKAINMISDREPAHRLETTPRPQDPTGDINLKDLPEKFVVHVNEKYGKEAQRIFSICSENPAAAEKLHPDLDAYLAEVIYFVRYQSCYHIDDVLGRRLALSYILPKFKDRSVVVKATADLMKSECGWSDAEYVQEQTDHLALLDQKNLYP